MRYMRHLPVLVVLVFYLFYAVLLLSQVGFNPTALADIGDAHPQYKPEVYPPGTIVWKDSVGYDGQFYYQIALHPFDLGKFYPRENFGEIPFRYQRILQSFLAFGLSLGNAAIIPWMMVLINVVALGVGTFFLAKIIGFYNGNPWSSLLYGLSVSSIVALRFDMPQVLALSLAVASLYYFLRGRTAVSLLLIALGALAYEASVLFLLAVSWELLQRKKYSNAFLMTLSVLPFLFYEFLLLRIFGELPLLTSGSNIGIPFRGLADSFRYFLSFKPFSLASQLFSPSAQKVSESFNFGLMVSAGMVFIFSLFVYFCIIPAASRFRQTVFHKALFLQVGYALVASPGVYHNFYNVARVFGGVFPLLVACYTIAPARYYRYLFTLSALFALVALAPFPNILQTYHNYFVLQ